MDMHLGVIGTMASPIDNLPYRDQVLVSLMEKNTRLGRDLIDQVVEAFVAAGNGAGDLAHHFVNAGHLSRTEMYRLVKARNFSLLRKEDKRIARRAVRRGYVSRSAVNEALDFQKQLFKALGDVRRLHDILRDDRKMTQEQVNVIWSEYRSYLERKGERPEEARTDPLLLKKQG